MMNHPSLSRRHFLSSGLLAAGACSLPGVGVEAPAGGRWERGAFVKFIQELPPREMARAISAMKGYTGIEATVRRGGQIDPSRVEDELPGLVEALREEGLEITVMATDVTRADDPVMEKTLRAAASLGIKRYRMGYYRYDLSRAIQPQVESFRPVAAELAALNRDLGLQGLYQNHAGAAYLGASLWDLDQVLGEIDPRWMAVGFDIRHATVEGGTTWPLLWRLVQDRLGAVYVKDFRWTESGLINVPLGEGRVDGKFFSQMARERTDVPFIIHVEYLEERGVEENLGALARDVAVLAELVQVGETLAP